MSETIKTNGSCHCGDVSFSYEGPKNYEFFCHCESCSKLNGGGHLAGIVCLKDGTKISGETSVYSYSGGSGSNINLNFCQKCGTHMFAYLDAHPDLIVLRANVLESDVFKPMKSLFPEEGLPWSIKL